MLSRFFITCVCDLEATGRSDAVQVTAILAGGLEAGSWQMAERMPYAP